MRRDDEIGNSVKSTKLERPTAEDIRGLGASANSGAKPTSNILMINNLRILSGLLILRDSVRSKTSTLIVLAGAKLLRQSQSACENNILDVVHELYTSGFLTVKWAFFDRYCFDK